MPGVDSIPGRSRGRRLPLPVASLVVPAVAGLGALLFLLWRPGVARSLAGSPRAAAFTLVVGGLVLGAGWLLPRLGWGTRSTAAAQTVPVVLAFSLTVLPAFGDSVVREAFPVPPAAGADGVRDPGPGAPEPAPRPVLARGSLSGIDHRADGDVLLVGADGGSAVVRLESLDVEPGPDYHLHVVPGAGATAPDGGVRLDRLRANRGDQNYPVPTGTTLDRPLTVLIWCRAFAVPVAAATLS